jgi:hypothetical protein
MCCRDINVGIRCKLARVRRGTYLVKTWSYYRSIEVWKNGSREEDGGKGLKWQNLGQSLSGMEIVGITDVFLPPQT